MKKITLLVASIFLFGNTVANAAEKKVFSVEKNSLTNCGNTEPVVFTERGVEFFIFTDGQLDFNTRPTNRKEKYYKSNSRGDVNRTYGAPNYYSNKNHGVKVEHDNMGRVRRVGNVFINYDSNDRVKRVGSVYMSYNRYLLEQVGGLHIIYDRRGTIIDFIGSVNNGKGYAFKQDNYRNNDYAFNQNSDEDQYYFKTNKSINIRDNEVIVIKR
ncbi:hypothetical protein RCH18_000192 [Flavobacterium sp. PL11]|uniref:hypothetical protein n=1 Tax=Flavobacterium sp. PL11 TaxID=3071717 RepID=UPI002DF9B39C|nr:hypothetical protein [Flavobacterium sp. PL11]